MSFGLEVFPKCLRKEPDLRPRQTDRGPEQLVRKGNFLAQSRVLNSLWGAARQG
jgi:hypothetical protein